MRHQWGGDHATGFKCFGRPRIPACNDGTVIDQKRLLGGAKC